MAAGTFVDIPYLWCARALVLAVLAAGCSDPPRTENYQVVIDLAPWIRDLGSRDPSTSEAAIAHLVPLKEAALPALREALRQEGPAVRMGIVLALAQMNRTETVPLLLIAAEDSEVSVRVEALLALGELGDKRGRDPVEAALAEADDRVMRAAADACVTLCSSPESFRRLTQMAVYDLPLHAMALPRQTLRQISRLGEVRASTAREAVRTVALPLLGEATPLLTRVRAALLLGDVGDATGVSLLNEMVTLPLKALSREERQQIHLQAVPTLGAVGDEKSVTALAHARETLGPPLRRRACRALAQLAQRHVGNAATELARCQENVRNG